MLSTSRTASRSVSNAGMPSLVFGERNLLGTTMGVKWMRGMISLKSGSWLFASIARYLLEEFNHGGIHLLHILLGKSYCRAQEIGSPVAVPLELNGGLNAVLGHFQPVFVEIVNQVIKQGCFLSGVYHVEEKETILAHLFQDTGERLSRCDNHPVQFDGYYHQVQ